jgi:hypothetical protein
MVAAASDWLHEAYVQTEGQAQSVSGRTTFQEFGRGEVASTWRGEVNPDGNPVPDSFAEAKAVASIYGPLRTYSTVGGAVDRATNPFDPRALSAGAQAGYYVTLLVESDTLPKNTPVTVSMDARIEGSLQLYNPTGVPLTGDDFSAYAYAFVQIAHSFTQQGANSPGVIYEGDGGFYDGTFQDFETWEDRFVVTNDGNGTITAALDVDDTVQFELLVGYEYQFIPTMSSYASLRKPLNVTLTSDFYNTATYSLRSHDPNVRVTLVPEPAALMALTAILAPYALVRRRRGQLSSLPRSFSS